MNRKLLVALVSMQLGAQGPLPKTVMVTSKEEGGPEGEFKINEDDFDPEKHELGKNQNLSGQPATSRPRVGANAEGDNTNSNKAGKKS